MLRSQHIAADPPLRRAAPAADKLVPTDKAQIAMTPLRNEELAGLPTRRYNFKMGVLETVE